MDTDDVHTLHRGTQPLLVSVPHAGTQLPDDQRRRYVERAFAFEDTDWHLATLFDFVRALGGSLIVPRYSRYLIDLNRPPDNLPMYPSANNTELCPTRFFTGDPLYRTGYAPDTSEVERRVRVYWQPYHDALRIELERIRAEHGHAVLFDGHSIKSRLPWLNSFVASKPGHLLSVLVTFLAVCVGWVFFRVQDMKQALMITTKMVTLHPLITRAEAHQLVILNHQLPVIVPVALIMIAALLAANLPVSWLNEKGYFRKAHPLLKGAFCTAVLLAIIVISPDDSHPFIYFQF